MSENLALVLRSVRFQDPSKIVTFFSRTDGLKTGFARGATHRDNRFGAALEPLTLSAITGRHHGMGSLYRIHHSSIVDPFRCLHADYNLLVWSGLFVRFLLGLLPPDHPEPDLFDLAVSSLSRLDRTGSLPDLVWSRFVSDALEGLGYRICLTPCVRCHRESQGDKIAYRASDGTTVCMRCFGHEEVSEWIMTSEKVLGWLDREVPPEGDLPLPSPEFRQGVRRFLDAIITEHLPRWIPLDNLVFLKEQGEV